MLTITEIHPDPPTCYLLPFRVLTWSPGDLVSFEQRLRQRVLDGCYTVTSLRRPYSLWLEAHGTSLLGMVQGTPDFTFFPTVLAWVETRLESLELSCPASRHLPIEAPETPFLSRDHVHVRTGRCTYAIGTTEGGSTRLLLVARLWPGPRTSVVQKAPISCPCPGAQQLQFKYTGNPTPQRHLFRALGSAILRPESIGMRDVGVVMNHMLQTRIHC